MGKISMLVTLFGLAISFGVHAKTHPTACVMPDTGALGVAVEDKRFKGAWCMEAGMAQLLGGKINYERKDVCENIDKNIAAPFDKVPYTVGESTFCLDRPTAEILVHWKALPTAGG